MKNLKLLSLFALLVLPLYVYSAPFVTSDATTQKVTHCGILLDTGEKVEVPVTTVTPTSAICKYDVGGVTVGTHTIAATFINNDQLWGRTESAQSVNFTFVRPNNDIANPPTGLDVTK